MSLDEFSPYTPMHVGVVLVCVVATWQLIRMGRRLDAEDRARFRFRIGLVIAALQVGHNAYWLGLRGEIDTALPLHLCDLAGLVAAAAFLCPTRLLRTVLYFWGAGLSSLAFVIPVLTAGPATIEFWSFWLSHWAIVGGAAYIIAAEGYRPTPRDLGVAIAITIGYGLLMVPVNILLGANYMYVGRESPPAEFLGAWPFPRLPMLALGVVLLLSAAQLPWIRRRGEQS